MPSSCKVNSVCVRLGPSPIPLSRSSGHGAAASQPTSRTDFWLSRTFVGCDNSGRVRMAASMACRKLPTKSWPSWLPKSWQWHPPLANEGQNLLHTCKVELEKMHWKIAQCGNSRRPPRCLQVVLFQSFLAQLDHGCTGNIRKHQESMESKSDSNDSKRAHLESSVSMSKAPWNMFSVSDVSIQWMNICNSLQWRVIISCTWTWLFGSQVCCQKRLPNCSKILSILWLWYVSIILVSLYT